MSLELVVAIALIIGLAYLLFGPSPTNSTIRAIIFLVLVVVIVMLLGRLW